MPRSFLFICQSEAGAQERKNQGRSWAPEGHKRVAGPRRE